MAVRIERKQQCRYKPQCHLDDKAEINSLRPSLLKHKHSGVSVFLSCHFSHLITDLGRHFFQTDVEKRNYLFKTNTKNKNKKETKL